MVRVTQINLVDGAHDHVSWIFPDELVVLGGVCLDLLVDLDLELLELLLHFVIDMSLVLQEVLRVVLVLLLGIKDILPVLPDVVDG